MGGETYKTGIVTELKPLAEFYRAEDYHQHYYLKNPAQGYCTVIIRPKMKKLGLE
jgi:peptide-methionine (S)-S-oxide reductase